MTRNLNGSLSSLSSYPPSFACIIEGQQDDTSHIVTMRDTMGITIANVKRQSIVTESGIHTANS